MKAVLFDLDDTLYSETTYVFSGFSAVADYLGRRFYLPPAPIVHRLRHILVEHGRGQVFNHLLEELALTQAVNVWVLVQIYRAHQPTLALDEEVLPTFVRLREQGLKLAVLTDGMASVQQKKVAALGLADWVDFVLCTDELGANHWKPSTVPFGVVLERLGVLAHQAVYVGDNDAKDFVGPRALGMTSVRTHRWRGLEAKTPLSHRADHVIAGLTELPRLLSELP